MADRLYLSCWLRSFTEANMLRHFQKMLELFPFSKLSLRGPQVRVYALEYVEPSLFEHDFAPATEPAIMVDAVRDFMHDDCVCEIDAAWDVWQFEADWKLAPSPVTLSCVGPQFDNPHDDHLRVDFGLESLYVPDPNVEGGLRMGQSNLKSLVHLVHEIERALALDRRLLWSESGQSPAEAIAKALVN
jgi:hypothetical protein